MSGIDVFIDDYDQGEDYMNHDPDSCRYHEELDNSSVHVTTAGYVIEMPTKGPLRHKHIFVSDFDPVERGHIQVTNRITWGKPAQWTQAVMDKECPICHARPNSDGRVFEIDYDGDGFYCHNCGWTA